MTGTRVYPAAWPLTGKWVVEHRSEVMKAPGFYYYDNAKAAGEAARRMRRREHKRADLHVGAGLQVAR